MLAKNDFFDHVWTDVCTGHIIGVGLTVVQWAGGKNATPCPPSCLQRDFFNKTKVQRNFALLGLSLRHCWTTLFEETIPIWVHTSYKMVPFSLLGLVKPLQAAAAVAAVTDGWTGAELFLRTILTKLLSLSNKPKYWYRPGSEKWDIFSENLHFLIIGWRGGRITFSSTFPWWRKQKYFPERHNSNPMKVQEWRRTVCKCEKCNILWLSKNNGLTKKEDIKTPLI